jgi:hypothetical protein
MHPLADRTRHFWCAAFYFRRAPHRDQSTGERLLEEVAKHSIGTVHVRAVNLLAEMRNERDDRPPIAG